jgi:hypothetical protein
MNTMPQALDEQPVFRARSTVPVPRAEPRRPDPHLKLVVDRPGLALLSAPALTQPYGLNGRRHLAHVPQAGMVADPQAASAQADNEGKANAWSLRRLEPMAFALVLLVSVAALVVALQAG